MKHHLSRISFCLSLATLSSTESNRIVEIARYAAAEANQGVAVDSDHFYAIDNRSIGKYRRSDGKRVGAWQDLSDDRIFHLNSGIVVDGKLYIAHSNFPLTPTISSVEIWDTATMSPIESIDLPQAPGSLTWIIPYESGWLACFAHYARDSDPSLSRICRLDPHFTITAQWSFPRALQEKFGKYSSSGGAFGPDGKLYLSGHDARELYVATLPQEPDNDIIWHHTLPVSQAGQAFAWASPSPAPTQALGWLYGIERRTREVVVSALMPPSPQPSIP